MDPNPVEGGTMASDPEETAGRVDKAQDIRTEKGGGMSAVSTTSLKIYAQAVVAVIEGGHLPALPSLSETGLEDPASGTAAQLAWGTEEVELGHTIPSPIAQLVAEQLRAICMTATYDSEVESAREMRFGLRLIVSEWRDMTVSGFTIRDFFRFEALRVVDPLYRREENVRFLAANAIGMVLEDAEWGHDQTDADNQLLPIDQQPSNVTLREVLTGIRTVNEELTAVLIADGSEDVEFDEVLSDEEEDDDDENEATTGQPGSLTASVPRPPAIPKLAPQGSSSAASLAQLGKKKVRRTGEEDGVLVQVARDNRGAKIDQLTAEHNRRMRTNRQHAGQTRIDDRPEHGVKNRLSRLRKTYPDI